MEKPKSFDDETPLNWQRVRRRLSIVIENMPLSTKNFYGGDEHLKNLHEDLIDIRGALDWLESQRFKRFNEP